MTNQKYEKFEFGGDDTDSEAVPAGIQEEMWDVRLEKMNQRVTLNLIIISVLICAVIAMVYMDVAHKVDTMQDRSVGVNNQQKDLETRVSSLQVAQLQTEKNLQDQLTQLDTAQKDLTGKLDQITKQITGLGRQVETLEKGKVNQKAYEQKITPLSRKIDAAINANKTQQEDFRKIQKNVNTLNTQLDQTKKALVKDIDAIQQKMEDLTAVRQKQMVLKHELALMTKEVETRVKTVATRMDTELNPIRLKLIALESRLSSMQSDRSSPSAGKPAPTPGIVPQTKKPQPQPQNKPSVPDANLIEQDIPN